MKSSSVTMLSAQMLLPNVLIIFTVAIDVEAFKPFHFRQRSEPLTIPLQTETLAPDPNQFQPTTSSSIPSFEAVDLAWSPMKGNDVTVFFPQNPPPPSLSQPSLSMPNFPAKRPFGSYEVISNPSRVHMTIAAKNVELVCSAIGEFKGSIRWVKLKDRVNNVQEFEVVADGEKSFDPFHYIVKGDKETSRLTIHNLDPDLHYGTYQCQVSLNGFGSFIQKLDFNIGVKTGDGSTMGANAS